MRLGADLAALLTERDIFRRSAGAHTLDEPDITERLEALRKGRRGEESASRTDPSARPRGGADLIAVDVLDAGGERGFREQRRRSRAARPSFALGFSGPRLSTEGRRGQNFVHVLGRGVRLSRDSHLLNSPYIIALNVDAGEKAEGFVHLAAPVDEALLRSECKSRVESVRRVEWDRKENRIVAAMEERLGGLLLSDKPFTPTDEEIAPILCDVVRATPGVLTFSREARQFQGRVGLMRRAFPEEDWPDLSDEHLLATPGEWLLPWLHHIRSAQALSALNSLSALKAILSWEQGRRLEERAPVALTCRAAAA